MEEKLYAWQEECIEKWMKNGGRGMVQAVTGSGKTRMALAAADQLEKRLGGRLRVKIVVPVSGLMMQWSRALKEFRGNSALPGRQGNGSREKNVRGEIGLRGGGFKDPPGRKYMIYVINSARYELARNILEELRAGENILLIADECHRYESGQNRLIFEFLPYIDAYGKQFFSLGLSATLPSGQARAYLTSVLGPKVYSYGMKHAAASGAVSPYDIYHIALSFQEEEGEEYRNFTERMTNVYRKLLKWHPYLRDMDQKGRFETLRNLAGSKDRKSADAASTYMKLSFCRKKLVCLAKSRCACAVSLLRRLGTEEKIIVFGERIQQAEELYGLLQPYFPGKVGRYHSQMGEQANRAALRRFREGELRILITCKSMDEGVDVPDASIGIILSGTSVQRQRIQRLGRILRKSEGKTRASLYYLHMAETSEDTCFLPETGGSHVFELEYLSDRDEFSNPSYDQAADAMLDKMRLDGADEEKLWEAMRCLSLGRVRGDWLSGPAYIEERIKSAKYVSEKNYWICMKKMRENI